MILSNEKCIGEKCEKWARESLFGHDGAKHVDYLVNFTVAWFLMLAAFPA